MARHRAEILEAAEEVFSESGFESARMEEIARRTEFAVGTLYKFFDSKEDLYGALLREKSEALRRRTLQAVEGDATPADKIRAVFRLRIETYWEHRRFFRVFFQETARTVCDPRAGATADIWQRYQEFLRTLEGVFQEGIDRGQFRGGDAGALTLVYEGMIRAYVLSVSREPDAVRDAGREEALLDIFLEGALARG